MSWATYADLLAKYNPASFPRLTELTGYLAGAPDETLCQEALDLAAAEMRSYLGGRVLPAADKLLQHIQLDLAYRNLYRDEVPKAVSDLAARHLITLKALARSEQSLGDPPVQDGANAVALTELSLDRERGF